MRRARWDFVPPFRTPLSSGTLGAPSAQPFGSHGPVRDLGKTDSHTRAEPLLTAIPVSLASEAIA
jgi:hypothetical protein